MNKVDISTDFDNKTTEDILEKATELGLTNEDLVQFYRTMITIRAFEEMADNLYALGKVHGTMHLSAGQEGVAAGTGKAMGSKDYLINHHRGHGHFIASGANINKMMAEFLGKDTGYCHGRGGSMHIADIESNNLGANGIVGGGMQLATGVGLAIKMKQLSQVALVIFGDGAANEGIFHESMNMASIWDLPIIYLCENNKYGMSADVKRVSSQVPFKSRAEAHGIPAFYIDGNDVLAVYEYMNNAVNHVLAGKGPIFIEAQTYRYFGHSKSDRNLYRSKEEIAAWKNQRDPISRFEELMIEAEVISENEIKQIEREQNLVIENAVVFAENSPDPAIETVTEFVYA